MEHTYITFYKASEVANELYIEERNSYCSVPVSIPILHLQAKQINSRNGLPVVTPTVIAEYYHLLCAPEIDLNEKDGLGSTYLGAGGEEIIESAPNEGALIPVSVPKNSFKAPSKPLMERRLVSTHNFPRYQYFAKLPKEALTALNRLRMNRRVV